MKIAVASLDGTEISSHFGRSPWFLIFEAVDGKISGPELRANTFTAHAKGACCGGHHDKHDAHSHDSIVEALRDCQAVLTYGMGARAAEALNSNGIQPFVLAEKCTPTQAVALFLEGKLSPAGHEFCQHHS